MTTIHDLRRAAQDVDKEIDLIIDRGHNPKYARKRIVELLTTLDAAEKQWSDIRAAQDTARACTDEKVKNEWIDCARERLAAFLNPKDETHD